MPSTHASAPRATARLASAQPPTQNYQRPTGERTAAGGYVSQFSSPVTSFNDDFGVAVDPSTGDVYVGDYGNDVVDKFTSGGRYLAQFGSAGSSAAQFEGPWGLAVDPSNGDTYVVDSNNNRVEKFGNP